MFWAEAGFDSNLLAVGPPRAAGEGGAFLQMTALRVEGLFPCWFGM